MIVIICANNKKNPSTTVDATEWTRFSKSRSNDLEDIGQGQGSSHATHPLMLLIITCDTPSHASDHFYQIWKESIRNCRCYRADTIFKVKAKWPWRYRSRSLHATHPLILVIICDKYGKNPSRTVDFLIKVKAAIFLKFAIKFKFPYSEKNLIRDTPSNDSDHLCQILKKNPPRTVDATERTRFSKSRPNDLEDIGQGQGSSHAPHPFMLLIICTKYGKNPFWTVDATGRTQKVNGQTDGQTDRQTNRVNPIYPP